MASGAYSYTALRWLLCLLVPLLMILDHGWLAWLAFVAAALAAATDKS